MRRVVSEGRGADGKVLERWLLRTNLAREVAAAAGGRLMRLSGRQLEWGKEFTAAGLLAGLGVLLVLAEVQEQLAAGRLRALADFILKGSVAPETG